MLILVTGDDSGFTLLEVLAIIVLIAVVMGLTYANLIVGAEKTEVNAIGKLLAGDIRQVRNEALYNHQEIIIEFLPDGYHYPIGLTDINRQFQSYQFAFRLPVREETPPETELSEKSPVTPEEDRKLAEKTQLKPGELKFDINGKTEGMILDWQSNHFKGDLIVNQDGTVKWHYERI